MHQSKNIIIIIKVKLILLIVAATAALIFSKGVNAQSVKTSLSPVVTELAIKPGRTADLNYKLTNKGDPAIYKVSIQPLEASDSNSISFELLNPDFRLNKSVFLKSAASTDLNLRVFIPEEIPDRDYYFTLLAESQPSPTQEGSANIRARITLKSPLLITVTHDGQLEIKPKISLMEVLSKNRFDLFGFRLNIFDSYQPIPIVILIDNKGKNLIKPGGEIITKGPLWQINNHSLSTQTVLANSQSRIQLELPGRFVGSYHISAHLNFGQGSPTVYATNYFLVIPFKFSLFVIILSIFIFFLLPKLKRRHIH